MKSRLLAIATTLFSTTLLAQTIEVHSVSPTLAANPLPPSTLRFHAGTASSGVDVLHVDSSQRFQSIDGFGASMTDSSAWLLQTQLSSEARDKTMHALFDPKTGAGLSFLRQPLGASDLALNHYSYDDVPAATQDKGVTKFSTQHDQAYIFPLLREAQRINPHITFMGTPWSPPAWMKTHDTMNGGALRDDAMADYATYLVKSVSAYKKEGIDFKYLTVQNEPLNETKDYPGTLMLADQQKHLIGDYLGPALDQAGLDTKILAYDHNWDHPEYPIEVLSYQPATKYLAGSALHCYGGEVSAQQKVHDADPKKGLWMTECSGGTWQQGNLLGVTAHLIIGSTRYWAKSVVLWGIALDSDHGPYAGGCKTCRGLIEIDRKANPHTVSYTIDFYAMQAVSKYVHPGAVRIASTDFGEKSLQSVAFENPDHSYALLVFNNQTEPKHFQLSWKGKQTDVTIAAGSFVTYVWR